ncbi:MAG: pilus assembly protein PilP [Rhodoferax sp.]
MRQPLWTLCLGLRGLALAGAGMVLVACTPAEDADLQQWMAEQKAQTRPRIKPITEPKRFTPESYAPGSDVDPFSNQKLTLALKKDSALAVKDTLLAPELARPKEYLEEFPLDSMAMVGRLERNGKPVALITMGKMLYQVQVGQHLGQNFGRITRITDNAIELREIAQDAVGEWIERMVTLQLQENSK